VDVFDVKGRHLRTLDALTGTPIVTFSYDAAGRLVKVEDRHQNALTVTRDGSGRATTITAPFGQVTTLGYDAAGLLATVTDAIGRKEQLEYAPGGLLTKRVDMGGGAHTMSYDAEGRLFTDADAENRRFAFSQEAASGGTKVDVTTGLMRRESHVFRAGPGVDEVRSLVDRDGTTVAWTIAKSGRTKATLPDGTEVEIVPEADPRLGMLAPYAARHVVRFPSGLTRTVESTWSANVDAAGAVIGLSGERRTPDGVTRMVYDGASRTWTTTTPAGRTLTATLDAEGRLVRSQLPGFLATDRVYDTRSRLASASTGARRTTLGYGAAGAVASVEDPLGRRLGISSVTGRSARRGSCTPMGAKSAYAYSPMDDLTQVTPPGKGAHVLTYGKDGQLASYVAPGASPIVVGYDGDRDLGKVTYEDGTATDVVRDAAGRPSRLVYAGGEVAFAYDAASGKLRTLTTTSGQGLAFGWDGALLRDVTATGVAPGTMASTYDTMLRQATESASGNVGLVRVRRGRPPDARGPGVPHARAGERAPRELERRPRRGDVRLHGLRRALELPGAERERRAARHGARLRCARPPHGEARERVTTTYAYDARGASLVCRGMARRRTCTRTTGTGTARTAASRRTAVTA
jgi:YD repeat-containing protein